MCDDANNTSLPRGAYRLYPTVHLTPQGYLLHVTMKMLGSCSTTHGPNMHPLPNPKAMVLEFKIRLRAGPR